MPATTGNITPQLSGRSSAQSAFYLLTSRCRSSHNVTQPARGPAIAAAFSSEKYRLLLIALAFERRYLSVESR